MTPRDARHGPPSATARPATARPATAPSSTAPSSTAPSSTAPSATAPSATWRVLMVCTGNICRSPMAERFARQVLAEHCARPLDAIVTSAGTRGWDGSPMHADAATTLAERGVDPAGFVARSLTVGMLDTSDLVLCATRAHRAAVVTMLPRAVRRCFTFAEFARLTAAVLPADLLPADPLPSEPLPSDPLPAARRPPVAEVGTRLVGAAYRQRASGVVATHRGDDDIRDPLGRGLDAFRLCGDQISAAIGRPFELLARAGRTATDIAFRL